MLRLQHEKGFFLFPETEQVKLLSIHQIPSSGPNIPTVQLPLLQQNSWRKLVSVEIQAWRRMLSLCLSSCLGLSNWNLSVGFQWSFSSGSFFCDSCCDAARKVPVIGAPLSPVELFWSHLSDGMMEWCFTSQGWGAASQDPGGRCPRLPVWSIPTGSSFCATFTVKDNHRFPAQQCRETPGKPGQTCPEPLLQHVPGFPEKLEDLRGLKIQPPHSEVHILFLMYPPSLLPRK